MANAFWGTRNLPLNERFFESRHRRTRYERLRQSEVFNWLAPSPVIQLRLLLLDRKGAVRLGKKLIRQMAAIVWHQQIAHLKVSGTAATWL